MMSTHTNGPWSHRNGRIFQTDYDVLTIANMARAFDGDYSPSNGDLIAASPELLEALEAYQTAQAMPEYGDYSSFEFAKLTPRYEGKPELGLICEKHGLGYVGRCLCCEDDFERHRADNDRKARNARDDALREAARKAAAAIAKAKGEQ